MAGQRKKEHKENIIPLETLNNIECKILVLKGNCIRVLIKGIDCSLANAIRRIMLVEVS